MKRIFIIDWVLIILFTLSTYSGFELHIAGHIGIHEIWHNWAVFHVVTSVLFFSAITCHISTHWNWYKTIARNGIGTKSKLTIILSTVFLFLAATGFGLFAVKGANSPLGLWHYRIGIIMAIIAIAHTLKRLPALHKSLKRNKHQH